MLKYKITKYKSSWNIILPDQPRTDAWGEVPSQDYPKLVRVVINSIKRNKLPYVKKCTYYTVWGTALTGGPYIQIILSPLVEDEDLDELQSIIEETFSCTLSTVTRPKSGNRFDHVDLQEENNEKQDEEG